MPWDLAALRLRTTINARDASLQMACARVNASVPGLSCTHLYNVERNMFLLWIAIDMKCLFGMELIELQRLALKSSHSTDTTVCFQFAFAGADPQRENIEFHRFVPQLPLSLEARALEACVPYGAAQLPGARIGCLAVNWLIADRVRHAFATCSLNSKPESVEELLVRLGEAAGSHVAHASHRCLMCGKDLGVNLPRPSVCAAPACLFQSRELGMGFSVEEEILVRPRVVELLLTFFSCSLLSRRTIDLQAIPKQIIEKVPLGTEYTAPAETNSDELSPNELTLFYALSYVPGIEDLAQHVRMGSLKTHLDSIDTRLYPLLQWLIGGCRAFIRVLEPERQFKDMQTPHQFVFECAAAEREAAFQKHQKASGSFFAFHGSSSFAWNSIIASGLKNLSNTENMSYGAMKGSGIYFSTSFHTSVHYAKPTKLKQPWARSRLGRHPRAVALCEIVDRPSDFSYTEQKCFTECTPQERTQGQLHVVPNEEFVHTRYLFVYNEIVPPPAPTHHIFALRASELEKLPEMQRQSQQQQQQQQQQTQTPAAAAGAPPPTTTTTATTTSSSENQTSDAATTPASAEPQQQNMSQMHTQDKTSTESAPAQQQQSSEQQQTQTKQQQHRPHSASRLRQHRGLVRPDRPLTTFLRHKSSKRRFHESDNATPAMSRSKRCKTVYESNIELDSKTLIQGDRFCVPQQFFSHPDGPQCLTSRDCSPLSIVRLRTACLAAREARERELALLNRRRELELKLAV